MLREEPQFSHPSDGISVAHDVSRGDKSSQQMRALEEGDINFGPHLRHVEFMSLLRSFMVFYNLSPRPSAVGYWYVAPPAVSGPISA